MIEKSVKMICLLIVAVSCASTVSCGGRIVECRCACDAVMPPMPQGNSNEHLTAAPSDPVVQQDVETDEVREDQGEPTVIAREEGMPSARIGECSGPLQFKDPNFERAVRKVLKKPVSPITAEDAAKIKEMSISGDTSFKEITDLGPLRCFRSLEYLIIYNVKISDLAPIGDLGNLQRLNLDGNELKDISPLANLHTLAELNIQDNPIERFDVLANMPQLLELRLIRVGLKDGAFLKNMSSLRKLQVDGNRLTSLGFLKNLTSLQVLVAIDNQIKSFPKLKGMPSIELLFLSNNQISDLAPLVWKDGNPTGAELNIQSNPINCETQKKNLESLSIMWPNILTDCPGFYRNEP